MKCLETRDVVPGMRRRRYSLPDGRRVTTYEVPATVLRGMGMSKALQQLEIWQRAEAGRNRQSLIKQRLREGVKPDAIAHEFGVTEQRVRQLRKAID